MEGLEGYVKAIKDLLEIGLPRKVIICSINSLYEKGILNKREAMRLKIITCNCKIKLK